MHKKPNFLIILTDQQRFDTIAAAGYPWMITPNMDRIVNEGCLFNNAHSPNPVCVPARYDMLTGKTGKSHMHFDNMSIMLNPALSTFPRVFSENGWRTAALGKSHFTPVTAHHGYDEKILMEEIPGHIEDDAYLQYLSNTGNKDLRNIHGVRPLSYIHPQKALIPDEHLAPYWLGQRAAEWIDKNSNRPFLLTLGWIKPHPPWNVAKSKKGIYADRDFPEPIEKSRDLPYSNNDSHIYGDFDTPEEKRKIREAYFEAISMVDEGVGIVLDALEHNNILDNTVIIFTADHGEMLQDKGFYQKSRPYDGSVRIPMAIRYPKKFTPGSIREDFVDLLDIFPTLLDIAGIDLNYSEYFKNQQLDGASLLNTDAQKRKIQFSHNGHNHNRWVMTRNKRYKYIYYFAGGNEYLYDMQNDPAEKNNLLNSQNCPYQEYKYLKEKAIKRESEIGPEGMIKDGNFITIEMGKKCFEENDWGIGGKYPRWTLYAENHYQTFGQKSTEEEAKLFLDEFVKSRDDTPPFLCPPGGKEKLLTSFNKEWGTKTEPFAKLLQEK